MLLERGNRFLLVVHIFGLNGQPEAPILAINVDDLRFNGITDTQCRSRIINAINTNISRLQVPINLVGQFDGCALGIDFRDRAGDQAATIVIADVKRECVLFQLLDTQRNTLSLRVNRQDHSLDLIAFLVVPDRFLTSLVPADIAQMHKSIDVTVKADEDAKIGNRLDAARNLIALGVIPGEGIPWILSALLDAK